MLLFWLSALPLFGLAWVEAAAVPKTTSEIRVKEFFSPLNRRDMPTFKGYTSDDERSNQVYQDQLKKAKDGFEDMAAIVGTVLNGATVDHWAEILGKYFPVDDCSDTSSAVSELLGRLVSEKVREEGKQDSSDLGRDLSDAVGDIKITRDGSTGSRWCQAGDVAFTTADGIMRLCPRFYNLPKLQDIDCDKLGDELKEDTMYGKRPDSASSKGATLVHELTHNRKFSQDILERFPICKKIVVDTEVNFLQEKLGEQKWDGSTFDIARGPDDCRRLAQGPDPEKAFCNASNYQWFVTELYLSMMCKKSFK